MVMIPKTGSGVWLASARDRKVNYAVQHHCYYNHLVTIYDEDMMPFLLSYLNILCIYNFEEALTANPGFPNFALELVGTWNEDSAVDLVGGPLQLVD